MPDDRFSDAADQHAPDAATAVGAHHDQIDLVAVGILEDAHSRRHRFDLRVHDRESLCGRIMEVGIRPGDGVLPLQGEVVHRVVRIFLVGSPHIQHVEPRSVLRSQVGRVRKSTLGARGKVGRHEDVVDLQHERHR